MWFPNLYQIDTKKKNPNYLNSLFIGLTAPILNLCTVLVAIFFQLIKNLFNCALAVIVLGICGVFGRVSAREITREARDVELAFKDITGKDLDSAKFLEDPKPYIREVTNVLNAEIDKCLTASEERRQKIKH
jgi:hypothetical protein